VLVQRIDEYEPRAKLLLDLAAACHELERIELFCPILRQNDLAAFLSGESALSVNVACMVPVFMRMPSYACAFVRLALFCCAARPIRELQLSHCSYEDAAAVAAHAKTSPQHLSALTALELGFTRVPAGADIPALLGKLFGECVSGLTLVSSCSSSVLCLFRRRVWPLAARAAGE
jgi:hypothetical protein